MISHHKKSPGEESSMAQAPAGYCGETWECLEQRKRKSEEWMSEMFQIR